MRDSEPARVGEVAAQLELSQKCAMRDLPASCALWKCLPGRIPGASWLDGAAVRVKLLLIGSKLLSVRDK